MDLTFYRHLLDGNLGKQITIFFGFGQFYAKCYVNVLLLWDVSTPLGCLFVEKLFEALFLTTSGFDRFIVGLNHVGLINDSG